MNIKVQLAPLFAALDNGETFMGFPIAQSVPGGQQAIITFPDDYTNEEIDKRIQDWHRHGLVVPSAESGLWRPEHQDYRVLWLPPDEGRASTAVGVGDTFQMIGVTDATRRRGKYGAGVVVLHLDTGVDRNHVAFSGDGGKQFARADPDDHGHGTHTASTVASAWGVAPDVVLWCANVLPGGSGSEAMIANGIRQGADYAVAQRAPAVMTMSLGGSASSVMDDACVYARQRGVVVVSAAGNSGPSAVIGSPARASDLIVLAVDRARNYASFTSGPSWVSYANRVSAPGVDIAAAQRGTSDGVLVSSGTSMATPHVAGQVALLLGGGV